MRNFWLVAQHEYGRLVNRRAFIILTLAVPLGFAVLIGVVILVERSRENRLPLGYVDQAGLLVESRQKELSEAEDRIQMLAFADQASAGAALQREEIQAFFVLAPNYPADRRTELYFMGEPPAEDVWHEFEEFINLHLVADLPLPVQHRLIEGPAVTVLDISNGREFSRDDFNIILPFIASLFFILATMSAAGYMLEVITDEKENRTMEVLLTSLTPGQLIGGKIVGLTGVILTQLGIYLVTALVALMLVAPNIDAVQEATIPWAYLGVMALFFLPSFLLVTAVMVAVGSAVTTLHQGQQVAGMLNLLFLAPVFFVLLIFENPGGPVVTFLSLFPPTAFLTISLRWGLGSIPLWQLGVSLLLLVITTLLLMWIAVRIFHIGRLRYGQPLSLRHIARSLRRPTTSSPETAGP